MKIILTGGGTAGHVYPALAMAEIIRKKYDDAEFLFIGRDGGEENRAVAKAGIELMTLSVEGISRRLTPKNLSAIVKAIRATEKAKGIIRKFGADMVIGTGGYVSWPILKAAIKLGIPAMIHESNAFPGLVTRMLGKRCDAVLLGFAEAMEHLSYRDNLHVIGNPVRDAFYSITRDDARRRLGIRRDEMLILSFGGSLGSEKINDAVAAWMKHAEHKRYRITHIHATGRRYYDSISSRFPSLVRTHGSRIVPYIDDMPLWLSAADLAITRSGAMTLSELSAAAVPSILIPSPNVTADHQTKNAEAMVHLKKAILLCERDLSDKGLTEMIERLYRERDELNSMKEACLKERRRDPGSKFLSIFDKTYRF